MYHFTSRVRYSETGENGRLTLTSIINYFQDCSTFHSEDCQIGLKYLEGQGKAWMLSAWQLEIRRYPRLGEEIIIGTWPYGNKGIYGYRNFVLLDKDQNALVKADSSWFLLDQKSGMPCRVKDEDVKGYGKPGEPLAMEKVSGKINLSSAAVRCSPITIAPYHIDTNHHVNNAQYVEFAREAAGVSFPIAWLKVDYRRAAFLGDVIEPRVDVRQGEAVAGLFNKQGEVCAVVWMKSGKIEETG
ncbi:MAG: acyl-[acyl-carrier-protein] thioesterase [Lachnospiraceae bacterium]|nr:acyl-[acyl-carrier-protein] thioesterase [Lachnospiraceae bacterium]